MNPKFTFKPAPELTPQERRSRAEARFKLKERQRVDAPAAVREYRDAQQAVRDRTAKLRAERLSREAAAKAQAQ